MDCGLREEHSGGFSIEMKIIPLKMMILPLKNDDFV